MHRSGLRRCIGALLVSTLAAAGCAGADADAGGVKIGFVASLSGTYQGAGEDMRDGFQLYLDLHGGEFGGRPVELIVADEGDGPATALPAATQLVKQERVDAVAGIVSSGSYQAISALTIESRIPLVGANGRPRTDDTTWLWHTSFIADEPGAAIAPYVRENVDGPVWAIGPDYQGGHDQLRGFTDTFTGLGGKLANPDGKTTFTPFPDTTNFLPYFNEIKNSGAEAVYAFYAGKSAIDFVTQYAQSDIKDLPLYAAYLTEGTMLDAQGPAAEGIVNVLNYSPTLDNPTNQAFVEAWSERHDRRPTTQAMASYDAAAVLDAAITRIDGDVTPEKINQAIGELGQIDSPRGTWQFSADTHSPVQRWYLAVVQRDGSGMTNQVVEELATLGD